MPATELRIKLQRPHAAQQRIIEQVEASDATRYVLVCGRRYGKSTLGRNRIIKAALAGKPTAWFAPTYKLFSPEWRFLRTELAPVTLRANDSEHRIELVTGGVVDGWSLDGGDPARGREYAEIVIDEAAMVGNLEHAWNAAIRPTLIKHAGKAWFLSTPRGLNYFHTLYERGQSNSEPDWLSWRQPSNENPHLPPAEIEKSRAEMTPATFAQEIEAIFTAPEGLVLGLDYDGIAIYEPGRNVKPPRTPWAKCKWRVVGIDPGGTDPSAMVALGVDAEERHQVYKQFRRKGVLDPITLHEWLQDLQNRGPITAIVIDTADAAGQLGTVLSTLSRMGWPMYPANRSKALGIPHLQSLFKSGRLTIPPDYQPVFEGEIYSWMFPPRKPDHVGGDTWATVVTTSEHHADLLQALRYACVAVLDGYPGATTGPAVVSSSALRVGGGIVSAGSVGVRVR